MDDGDALGEAGQALAGDRQGRRIPIHPDEPGSGVEHPLRVAARSQGAVEDHLTGSRGELLDHLVREDRQMRGWRHHRTSPDFAIHLKSRKFSELLG